jgi:hypothetical protein
MSRFEKVPERGGGPLNEVQQTIKQIYLYTIKKEIRQFVIVLFKSTKKLHKNAKKS